MMAILPTLLVVAGLSVAHTLPTAQTEGQSSESTYASDASKIIATHMLQSNNDIDGNQVHAPLGVATMLAVLAEGSAGETYDEFNKVFGYPKERSGLRESFKRILAKYQTRKNAADPSFKTWLYIYRNHSAREEFKRLIRDTYFVDVKEISREEYDLSDPNTSSIVESTTISNSKDVIGFETLKRLRVYNGDESDGSDDGESIESTTERTVTDNYGDEVIEKETSKFDRHVEDQQYVEKPTILGEIKKAEEAEEAIASNTEAPPAEKAETVNEEKDVKKRENDLNPLENETVQDNEKTLKNSKKPEGGDGDSKEQAVIPIQEILDSNEPKKVTLPLQKLQSPLKDTSKDGGGEIMLALESQRGPARSIYGARSLFLKDDISNALTSNAIRGREQGSKTKMLLFNGLYHRGRWSTLFYQQLEKDEFFFITEDDAVKTPMMHADGQFHVAELPHLNAKVLCLPYENHKYALLVVLPNEVEGLHSVVSKMQPSDFQKARKLMEEKELHVVMPKFQIEETSRSESMLKGLGLRKLFSRKDADLSLLSDDHDLHVDEIVQFVNIRVDEGGAGVAGLSATNTQGRTAAPIDIERIEVNHPFLYFVMDCEHDFVLVSGKVYNPELKEDQPVSVEVALESA